MASANQGVIEKTMSFRMDNVVARYAKDYKLSPQDAQAHEKEFKRYMALVASNPGTIYGMCGPIDNLWHTFLTFTLQYQEFSQVTAQRFIHHFPNEHEGDKGDSKERKQHYELFSRDYIETYGEEPPKHLWPYAMDTNPEALGCSTCRCCVALS